MRTSALQETNKASQTEQYNQGFN